MFINSCYSILLHISIRLNLAHLFYLLSLFFFSSRRRHTIWPRDWSSDVCSSDLRSYRGLVQQPRPEFGDILSAQQQLNGFVASYLTALQAQWQGVADLAALAQLDDLYQIGRASCRERVEIAVVEVCFNIALRIVD